jgi:hypothetical protein
MDLPLVPALILTGVAMAALHWFPLFHPRKLSRPAAYATGAATVGLFLSWHQYSHASDWRLYWLFYAVAGGVVVASWALDAWVGREVDRAVLQINAGKQSRAAELVK